jgi:Cu(I)/Ag(I) efflux system membrane fusion protein
MNGAPITRNNASPELKLTKRSLGGAAIAIALAFCAVSRAADSDAASAPGPNAIRQPGVKSVAVTPTGKLWVCPMHHEIVRNHPGTCPICGMDLVEMASTHEDHHHGVHVDTASLQKLGVRVAPAKLQSLTRDISTYGTVAIDASQQFVVTSKVEGIIRKLNVSSVGQPVKAGQVLYEIDSLDLLQIQREYIALLREKDAMVAEMTRGEGHSRSKGMSTWDTENLAKSTRDRMSAREKLLYSDMSEESLAAIDRTYKPTEVVPIRAARSGVVTEVHVREGSVVKPMDSVLSIANLTKLWIEVPLYPDQLPWVRSGDLASIKLPPPDHVDLKGRLVIANPVVDDPTRTVRARIAIDNPRNQLRVGTYVDVTLHAEPHQALVVPRSAVMRTGKGDWVMLSEDDGYFAPVKVEVGIEAEDLTEIVAGLKAGDQIAVNGQFLLDSAASLSEDAEP